MPVIRIRKKRASLSRLLRGRYASVADEKFAMESWAHSQTNLWHADALNRFAGIGLPEVPLWSNGLFGLLFGVGVFYIQYVGPLGDCPIVGFLMLGGMLGLTCTLPLLVQYLRKPNARRAALWLAWLGNKEALPHLLRALRPYPLTPAQRTWQREVEVALTELLDILPPGSITEAMRERLEILVARGFGRNASRTADDFTLSRAYLCAAILRFLYRDSAPGRMPRLLVRVLKAPVEEEVMPNRFLVREVAELYSQKFIGTAVASIVPKTRPVTMRERILLLGRRS